MSASLNPAGGRRYHERARRYRSTLWPGFIEPLADWLLGWSPRSANLLVVGPSAGYCLPGTFLARFATIQAVDPDPLARRIFRQRFPALAARVGWTHDDFLAPRRGRFDQGRLRVLFDRFPGHAVLFSNVLGQLDCLYPEAVVGTSFGPWAAALGRLLAGREWASFHDRLSGTGVAPEGDAPLDLPGWLDERALGRRVFGRTPGATPRLDVHRTGDLFREFAHLERRILVWQIEPGSFHVIEGIRQP